MASRKQQYALLLSDNIVVSLVSIVNGISVEIPCSFPLSYTSQLKPLSAENFPKPLTSLDGFLLLMVPLILKMPTRWPQLIPILSPISLVIGYGTFPPFQKFNFFFWKCLQNSLPVKQIQMHRGILKSDTCDICNSSSESITHILRHLQLQFNFNLLLLLITW